MVRVGLVKMPRAQRATMNPLHALIPLFPLLALVQGLKVLQPTPGQVINALDSLLVRWDYNSSTDPPAAALQVSQKNKRNRQRGKGPTQQQLRDLRP
ncbi:hypothetical protein BDV23DRAFT_143680 [Aspergillus alliaceus]|uniref:Secreted protein n=1 Tax=Petromyces alliaceus TaxID=209559 RepID=A0A5N7CRD2_PETAA|nr:hypothetical protein BDV23DRAFT_143680 [Aspergillus alliaceus]